MSNGSRASGDHFVNWLVKCSRLKTDLSPDDSGGGCGILVLAYLITASDSRGIAGKD